MDVAGGAVRAAGGLVRRHTGGEAQVLLVHRPAYGDWTFPKGKAEQGEPDADCALREVEEETGLRCAIDVDLSTTAYTDAKGRPKVVRYFSMHVLAGAFTPHHEVDEIRWLTLAEAAKLLSYERDRELLGRLADVTTSA